MKLIIFFIYTLLEISSGSEPQVYENVDDQIQEESITRVVRQPLQFQARGLFKPQTFEFGGATQQDPRKFRYAQQQKVDMKNFLRGKMITESPLRVSLLHNFRAEDPTAASSTVEDTYQLPEEKTNGSVWAKVTKRPVTSRKLKPSSYYEDLGDDKIKRQDNNQIVYINPELIKTGRTDYDLNALSALVGQHPNNQLEGLKRLLQNPQHDLVFTPIQPSRPHPITEHVDDIPNPNTHPNVDTSQHQVTLDSLQNQLDEAAKAQVAKALADAQREAQAHVEAQHQAIAKAQEEAQKKALAAIALHNQGIKRGRIPQVYHPIKEVLPQPLAYTLKQEVPVNLYAPSHGHQELVKDEKIEAGVSPSAYQQVLLETHGEKVHPGVNHLRGDDSGDHHQYAARYAFGYKIRDAKMGNEFGHEEKRDGENAKGLYHVLLPDGRMQKVEYYADPSGYHAKVTYENLAHH